MRILIIEDDVRLCEVLRDLLTKEGYRVDICHEGDDGLRWMRERAHNLVLLDRMLPCLDGINLLRIAREQGITTPVLIMTALGSEDDRVEGLDLGADDYLVKPFSIKELTARVRALSRRPYPWSGGSTVAYGDLTFDPAEKRLERGKESVVLSKREADLLAFFLQSGGKTLPRSTLLSHVWGPDAAVEDGNLDSYIHFLRRHLKAIGSACRIVTVRSTGYQMKAGQ